MIAATLFTIAKICNLPEHPSVAECIKKMPRLHTMEYDPATKEQNPSCTTKYMKLVNALPSDIRQISHDFTHMQNLKQS